MRQFTEEGKKALMISRSFKKLDFSLQKQKADFNKAKKEKKNNKK